MAYSSQTYTYTQPTVVTSLVFSFGMGVLSSITAAVDGVANTSFSVSGNTLTFNPAVTASRIVLQRVTDLSKMPHDFSSGAMFSYEALDEQNDDVLCIAQETRDMATASSESSAAATQTAQQALTQANAAVTTANGIAATANSALSASAAATSTANSAADTANGIAATANTALANANSAVTTANTASSNASTALSTANGIAATANTALSNSTAAVSTANSAASTASSAAALVGNYKSYGAISASRALLASESGSALRVNGESTTVTTPTAAANLRYKLYASHAFTLTIADGGKFYGYISADGSATINVPLHASIEILCDGGNWEVVGGLLPTAATEQLNSALVTLTDKVEDYLLYKPLLVAKKTTSQAQTLAAGAETKLTLTAQTDTAGAWSNADNRYTVPVAGWYRVDSQVRVISSAVGNVYVMLRINGVAAATLDARYMAASSLEQVLPGSMIVHCSAGDYIELWVNQAAQMAYSSYSDSVGLAATKLMITLERLD